MQQGVRPLTPFPFSSPIQAHDSGIVQQGDCLMSVDGVNVFGKSFSGDCS